MATDQKRIERILNRYQKFIDDIADCILEGMRQGLKKGVASGARKAAREVLKNECLRISVLNISGADLPGIVEDIAKIALSKNIAKETLRVIEGKISDYLDKVKDGIIDEFQKEIPALEPVVTLIRQREKIIVSRLMNELPDNPLTRGLSTGLEKTLSQATDRNIAKLKARLLEQGEGLEAPATGDSELEQAKKDLKTFISKTVAMIVEEYIYELVLRIMRRAIACLQNRLKKKLQSKLAEIAREKVEEVVERQIERLIDKPNLQKAIESLQERVTSGSAKDLEAFVNDIDANFNPGFTRYLRSLVHRPAIPIVVVSVIVVVTVGYVVAAPDLFKGPVPRVPTRPAPTTTAPPNVIPVGVARIAGTRGLIVSFDGRSSRDPDGRVVSWQWSFGDGATSSEPNPVYTYLRPGRYTATLRVTDNNNAQGSPVNITVDLTSVEPPVILEAVLPRPTVNFFGPMAKTRAGTIYLAGRTGQRTTIYKSSDFGASWTDSDGFPAITGPGITDIAVSDADANTIYVADGISIWKTTNGGLTWAPLPDLFSTFKLTPGVDYDGYISSIDIGEIANHNRVFAGTSSSGRGRGEVFYMIEGETSWLSLGVATSRPAPVWKPGTTDIYDVVASPNFTVDQTVMALATNEAGILVTGIVMVKPEWNTLIRDMPLLLNGKIPIRQPLRADISLLPDFLGSDITSRNLFVGIASLDPAGGDVFRITGDRVEDMDITGAASIYVTDIAISSQTMLVGGDSGTGKPAIYRGVNIHATKPDVSWSLASRPPAGGIWNSIARVSVILHDEFGANGRALAATGGFDCSVFSTNDRGTNWSHAPVTDSSIRIRFSKPMDPDATNQAVTIMPDIAREVRWMENNQLMIIRPLQPWQPNTRFEIIIRSTVLSAEGTRLENDVRYVLLTQG